MSLTRRADNKSWDIWLRQKLRFLKISQNFKPLEKPIFGTMKRVIFWQLFIGWDWQKIEFVFLYFETLKQGLMLTISDSAVYLFKQKERNVKRREGSKRNKKREMIKSWNREEKRESKKYDIRSI